MKFFALILISFSFDLCLSIQKEELFPYGLIDERLSSESDDISSAEIQLSVPIVFYETIYKSIFINDNGILSFLTEVPSFFNSQFPLSYPIIAPMYSDVDIRRSGAVYYRETKALELLERANQEIVRHFSKATQFRAQTLFITTWSEVGRYDQKTTPTNTAQVVIATNGTESYVFFLYPENGIQWIQGDGKISNLPDARTQSGFMSGDGRYYNLQGSGTEQIRNFDKMSNVYRPGVWIYKIGNLRSGNIIEPDIDGDRSLAKQESDTCSTAQLPCPPYANCIDYRNGFCCSCVDGYFGNGRECLMNNQPLRMTGKVRAFINNVNIDGADLHTYVATDEGRSYTAISRIPPNIGFDMQTLYTLGSVVGWLFASTKSGAPNGFMLTGGIFNRTAKIEFSQTGHQIDIRETFLGPDVFNFLRVEVEIRGNLPEVPFQSKIEVDDYSQQFTRVRGGVIRSHSTHSFRFGENSLNIPIIIEQTIEYNECQYKPLDERQSTLQLTVARNYIIYDNKEEIVRYASTSRTAHYNLSSDDPCRTGRSQCGEHSSCIVEGLNFKCICDRGYENDYREETFESQNALNVVKCVDINECTSARSNCHEFAACINIPGSYTCRCNPGYSGNGYQCQKELNCEDMRCDPNAECIHSERRQPECKCKSGFTGDGRVCTRSSSSWDQNSETEDCRTYNLCDINAECKANPLTRRHQCFCRPGYRGDGIVCIEESESCELLDNCGTNAECISDAESNNAYYCACNPGYVGDGYTCFAQLNSQSCNQVNSCHSNGQCIYDPTTNQYLCRCNEGFIGDGYQCTQSSGEVTCNEQTDICSPNADCIIDPLGQKNVCQCRKGFRGDGVICYPTNECDGQPDTCHRNARCLHNSGVNRYECRCNEGYSGDGKQCVANEDATCDLFNNCHTNATCAFDLNIQKYTCQCNNGFKGDGKTCKQHILSCNIINNCDIKAECKYHFDAQGYRCQCYEGFIGDGFNCRPVRTCREDPSLCDRNADCQYVEQLLTHVCHCRYGYIGDGFQCSPAPRHDGDYLLFTQGMSLLRIPLQPTKQDKGRLLLTKPHQIPAGLDVDCLDGLVYWSDVAHGVIYRATYNGSSTQTVIEGVLRSPEGIAVDWVSRNIYWTDSLKDTIEVSKLDGKMHKTLISEGLGDPRGIVVHPGSGKMYWTDWNREGPKIEVSNLDGTSRTVLVTTDLGLPNNLAIDYDRNDLCWTDAGLHRIECIDLYSNSRRIVHTPTAYPFDLTINGNSIYWTDWEIKFIQKVDRNGGKPDPLELPLGGNGKVYSIVTVPRHCPRISNACSVNNGGCRHLCLPNGRGRTCMCPDTDDIDSCNEIPK